MLSSKNRAELKMYGITETNALTNTNRENGSYVRNGSAYTFLNGKFSSQTSEIALRF